jgi:tetratricopeptide (TPR) repeat protein
VQAGFSYCALQAFTDEEALASLDAEAGDHSAARALANRAVARAQAFADGDPKSERRIGHLAKAYFVLASVSRAAGDWKQAREAVARAVTLWRTVNDASVLALHRPAKEEAEAMLREMAGSSP